MHFSLLHSDREFEKLRDDWKKLLPRVYARSPFQEFGFLWNWWDTRGGGEWPDASLWLGTFRDDSGELCGIAPLFLNGNNEQGSGLHLLGANEVADYLDLIVRKEDAAALTEKILDFAQNDKAFGIGYLDFNNLPQDSPTIPVIITEAERRGLTWNLEKEQVCPYIPLSGNWESYLAALKKKQRHEIRRKLRRFVEDQGRDTFHIVQKAEEVEMLLPQFLEMMRTDEEKKAFLTDPMSDFFASLVSRGAKEGWLKLAVINAGEKMAAAYLFFKYDKAIWLYNSGFNPEAYHLSPGWVLLSGLIQWGFEEGLRELDFMRGDEDYKYRFGGVNRFVKRLRVYLHGELSSK